MPTDTPDAIAARLTKAQREALVAFPIPFFKHGIKPSTLRSLREGGLRGVGFRLADYAKISSAKRWYLLPLGIAVRAALTKGTDDAE